MFISLQTKFLLSSIQDREAKMVSFIVDLHSFSPNGLYLACVVQTEKRVLVRACGDTLKHNVENKEGTLAKNLNQVDLNKIMKVEYKINLPGCACPVNKIAWSPDSQFIGIGCTKSSVVSIHSLLDSNWKCRVSLGSLDSRGGVGLENFWWSKDARHVLCLTGESTYLTVWSIRNRFVQYLKNVAPLPSNTPPHSFSPDGSLLAVVHAHVDETRAYVIAIYSTDTWKKKKSFEVRSKDPSGISWCPTDGDCVALWDSLLFSNLYIYQVSSGQLLKQYSPYGMTCGFESVQWSPSGAFVVGTVQNKNEVHVLNGLTFGTLIHDVLEPSYADSNGTDVYYETAEIEGNSGPKFQRLSGWPSKMMDQMKSCHLKIHYSVWGRATHVKVHNNGHHLACRTHLYPHVVWIYDLILARLITILIHQRPVSDFDWNPLSIKLAVLSVQTSTESNPPSGSALVSFWKPDAGVYAYKCIKTRQTLSGCKSIEWSPLGDLLLLRNEDCGRIHLFHDYK